MNLFKKFLLLSSLLFVSLLLIFANSDKLNIKKETIDIDPSENKLLTYDEMFNTMLEDGYTESEIYSILAGDFSNNNEAELKDFSYATLSKALNVSPDYKPTLKFYIQVDSRHGAYYIYKILKVDMNRQYNSKSKTFAGNIYYNLETNTKIYYSINGDFYNNGTINTTGGGSVGIGEGGELYFSLTGASSHFKYFYEEDYVHY
ncbi:hypothetical protein [Peptoniphilus hominis (ex Hitch et al. 2025)]|uniref:Uncharacterized protein n=1 Tax=Peptoniphilus hominis (ex Hitch et al. 2025) TaxID=3133174 RepID=A0ABV1CDJ6_9FIRM